LRWTCKSTRRLAETLQRMGYDVNHVVVAKLLRVLGYILQANAKTIEGGDHPDRDTQITNISTCK